MSARRKKEPRQTGMDPGQIFDALELLETERHIPKKFMLERIVQALTTAYKKDHSRIQNVIVDIDEEHRNLQMYVQKTVVAPEEFTDPENEISLPDAQAISGRYSVGDTVNFPVNTVEFGRIAAGNGKQVIIQGIREAERGMVYDQFSSKQNEMVIGTVTRIDPRNGNATLRIGSESDAADALLAAEEQMPGEELKEDMRIRVYVLEVRKSNRGPQVLLSRTHPGLVRRLFELEVPEIYNGTVEIRSISREAGSRAKVAVCSNDPNVDPIGACIGPGKQRIEAIVKALGGEKIDLVRYVDELERFVAGALAPAEVLDVQMLEDGRSCRCIVPGNQLSLAIGKEGQNVRLAARLTGCKIDIKPDTYQDELDAGLSGTGNAVLSTGRIDDEEPDNMPIPAEESGSEEITLESDTVERESPCAAEEELTRPDSRLSVGSV